MAQYEARSRENYISHLSDYSPNTSVNADFSGIIAQFRKDWGGRTKAKPEDVESEYDRRYRLSYGIYDPENRYSVPRSSPPQWEDDSAARQARAETARQERVREEAAAKERRRQQYEAELAEYERLHPEALIDTALYREEDGKFPEALALYHRAGEAGVSGGLWGEAMLYLRGKMGTDWPAVYHHSLPLLDKLIAKGDAKAMGQASLLCAFMDGRQDGATKLDLKAQALHYAQMGAQKGDPWSMGEMALRLRDGRGVEPDMAAAQQWLQKALNKGNNSTRYALGIRLRNSDPAAALSFFKVVAAASATLPPNSSDRWICAMASREVGAISIHSQNETERQSGFNLLKFAFEAKNDSAIYPLAMAYRDGLGTAADEKKAVELFAKGAENLENGCLVEMGGRLRDGRGVPIDRKAASFDFIAAGLLYKNGVAMSDYARLCHNNGDNEEAFKWLEKAGDAGYQQAKIELSDLLRNGKWGRKDLVKSRSYLTDAALDGYYPAAQKLAKWAHEGGDGLEKNDSYAKLMLEFATQMAGLDTSVWVQTGQAFARGDGVAADLDAAEKWLKKAADNGDAEGKKYLQTIGLMKMMN